MSLVAPPASTFTPPSSSLFRIDYQLPEGEEVVVPESQNVLILGAGPGGLVAGIQALLNQHQVTILEKRGEDELNRGRIIRIDQIAIDFLTRMGLVDELKRASSGNWTTGAFVAICELQRVLLAKFKELGGTIHYRTTVEYDAHTLYPLSRKKLAVWAKQPNAAGGESLLTFADVALVVVAEGARSPTRNWLFPGRVPQRAHDVTTILVANGETEPLAGWAACRATLLALYYAIAGLYYFLRYFRWQIYAAALQTPAQLSISIILHLDQLNKYRAIQQELLHHRMLASLPHIDSVLSVHHTAKAAAALKRREEFEERMVKIAFLFSIFLHFGRGRPSLPHARPLKRDERGRICSEIRASAQFLADPLTKLGGTFFTCIGDAAQTVHPISGGGANNAMIAGMTLPFGQLSQRPETIKGCLQLHADFAYNCALSDWQFTRIPLGSFGMWWDDTLVPRLSCVAGKLSMTMIESTHCTDPKNNGPRLILSTAPSFAISATERPSSFPLPQ